MGEYLQNRGMEKEPDFWNIRLFFCLNPLLVDLVMLKYRLAGQFHSQSLEGADVHIGQHDRGVGLAAF